MNVNAWIVVSPILFMLLATIWYNYKIHKQNEANKKENKQ